MAAFPAASAGLAGRPRLYQAGKANGAAPVTPDTLSAIVYQDTNSAEDTWNDRARGPTRRQDRPGPIRSPSWSKVALKLTNPLAEAVSRFGAALKPKLSGKGAVGAPEDQLRAPIEVLVADVAAVLGFNSSEVVPVGEASLAALKTGLTTPSR